MTILLNISIFLGFAIFVLNFPHTPRVMPDHLNYGVIFISYIIFINVIAGRITVAGGPRVGHP